MYQPIMFTHLCDVIVEAKLFQYQCQPATMLWSVEAQRAVAVQFCGWSLY